VIHAVCQGSVMDCGSIDPNAGASRSLAKSMHKQKSECRGA
jgi:hypothetical protein